MFTFIFVHDRQVSVHLFHNSDAVRLIYQNVLLKNKRLCVDKERIIISKVSGLPLFAKCWLWPELAKSSPLIGTAPSS